MSGDENRPVPMSKDTLVMVLKDILELVEKDDSFEGSLEYLMPAPGDPETTKFGGRTDFMVRAAYRTGNSMGQGGMVLIGTVNG